MSTTVSQVKEKLDIVTVIGSYLKLEAAGVNWKARCPFHNERTASFFVSPVRQSFYCFGCQKGGDIISFVEAIEGLDFMGALRLLADRAGVKLGPVDYHRERATERAYQALEAAANYYATALERSGAASDYLARRGVSAASRRQFRLGWAGSEWQGLANHLIQTEGFTAAELATAGVIVERGARHFDRFRERLIFPLLDRSGRVISLAGRTLGPATDTAKYINGPETPLYHKSEFLYGYHLAREAIRQSKTAVLVEGYLDLILTHQLGLAGTVAVSGTALTAAHLTPLKHLAEKLVLAFDGDEAGQAAAGRAARLGLTAGFEVLIVGLPAGTDPADLAQSDPTKLRELIATARPVIDWYLAELERKGLGGRAAIGALEEKVYPLLLALRSPLHRAHYVGRIAALTGLRDETIEADLAQRSTVTPVVPAPSSPAVPPNALSRQAVIARHILGLWWWQKEPSEWRNDLVDELVKLNQAQSESLVLLAELHYGNLPPTKLKEIFDELIGEWEKEEQKQQTAELQKLLRTAEVAGNEDLKNKHLTALQQFYEAHKKNNQKNKK